MGMSNMLEGIVLSLLFVVLLTFVLVDLNDTYDKDFSVGLDTSYLNNDGALADLMDSSHSQVDEGEVVESSSDSGLSLKTSWALGKGIFGMLWEFFNGNWINNIIINILKIPGTAGITTAFALKILFFATLIWAVLKLFFKVMV
jgi:hypothetical protein